jgi:hypothetical protein
MILGPTQRPIQWVTGALSLGVKRPVRGAIPPLPNTPSWCGAQLKHRDNFTFTFITLLLSLYEWIFLDI